MASDVTIDDAAVEALLAKMTEVLSPVYFLAFLGTEVEAFFLEETRSRFESEGDDAAGAWEQLKDSTINRREYLGFGPSPINQRTRDLYNYMMTPGILAEEADEAVWNYPFPNRDPILTKKFLTAQQGDAQTATPPRPVLAASDPEFEEVIETFQRWIFEKLEIAE